MLPLLKATALRLGEELAAWDKTLQDARRQHPHLCFVPTRQLGVLREAFTCEAPAGCPQQARFYSILQGINRAIPLSPDLCGGLRVEGHEGDYHAVVRAIGARLEEIMRCHPAPALRRIDRLGAASYCAASGGGDVDGGAGAANGGDGGDDLMGGGEAEAKQGPPPNVGNDGADDAAPAVRPPRVAGGQLMVVSTPTTRVCARPPPPPPTHTHNPPLSTPLSVTAFAHIHMHHVG